MAPARFPYAPAPESRAIVNLKPSYGLFIDGEFVDPLDGGHFKTESPSSQEVLAEVSSAGPADVDRAVRAARRAQEEVPARCPARSGGNTSSGRPHHPGTARELAVLESLDNGKPIEESRDVDVPLAAAHFFYHAGWADKLDLRRLRRPSQTPGGSRPDHPLELPTAHGGLEARPSSGDGQHLRPEASGNDPAFRAPAGRDLPAGRTPPRRRQHRYRRRRHRCALVTHPGVDKVAFTGSTEVGKRISAAWRGAEETQPGAGRQGGQHRFRRLPAVTRPRGHRQRHIFQPGPRLLRRVAFLVQEPCRASSRTPRPSRPCAWAIRSIKTPTSAPSTNPSNSKRIRELVSDR